jgi:hypothetical protein
LTSTLFYLNRKTPVLALTGHPRESVRSVCRLAVAKGTEIDLQSNVIYQGASLGWLRRKD